jgi:hypothetical protein
MTTLAHPNGELVGQAWLIAYAGFDPAQVAGHLPAPDKWTASGFVQVRALSGGGVNADLPEHRTTVLQVDLWGTRSVRDTFRPLWGVAMSLAEQVATATYRDVQHYGRPLTMPVPDYLPARALAAVLLSEPVRVEDDPSGYARMTTNLSIAWTV